MRLVIDGLPPVDILFIFFVAGPVLLSLFFVETTLVVIAMHNFLQWAERKWWK